MCSSLSMTEQKAGLEEKSSLIKTIEAQAAMNSKNNLSEISGEQGEFWPTLRDSLLASTEFLSPENETRTSGTRLLKKNSTGP